MLGPQIRVTLESGFFGVQAYRDGTSPVTLRDFRPTKTIDLRRCHVEATTSRPTGGARSVAAVLRLDVQEFPE